jgi:twitching motility protein PilT
MARVDSFLRLVVEQRASDLHLHAGNVPIIRYHKELLPLPFRQLSEAETERFLREIMTPEQRAAFDEHRQVDFAYQVEGHGRFRVNVYDKLKGMGAVFRVIPDHVPTIDELMLPPVLKKLAALDSGLVLIAGPTGSGKSTTLAAIVNQINTTSQRHVITIEDPIEFIHTPRLSVITQRQIGQHAASFSAALRSALRESPDVIVVGELRDRDSVALALAAAETGSLVFATVHTNSAAPAIDRIIHLSEEDVQEQMRSVVSVLLRAVIAQHLCRLASEEGLVAACEVLLQSYAVAHMIRESKTHQIEGYLQSTEHRGSGMQSLDACLIGYVREGVITAEEALHLATHPDTMAEAIKAIPGDEADG